MNVLKKLALASAVILCTQSITFCQDQNEQDQSITEQEEAFMTDDMTEAEEAELAEMDAEDEATQTGKDHSQED